MQTGTIFNIQPFSVYDGPGIRTTVFFKGCNLRCAWCHNPESWIKRPQLQFNPEKCIGCGACLEACPNGAHRFLENCHEIDRDRCTGCGICTDTCYTGALAITGKSVSSAEVMDRIREDALYFANSGGGVTFSGGECMMQLDFLAELLHLCQEEGIHTAVDTAGNFPFECFRRILPDTSLFLYDIKAFYPQTHQKLTGVKNDHILRNLPLLLEHGAEVIVRIPCVPGGNWDEMEEISDYLRDLPVRSVELLAYHRLGEGKRNSLGMEMQTFTTPTGAQMDALAARFREKGIPAVYNR